MSKRGKELEQALAAYIQDRFHALFGQGNLESTEMRFTLTGRMRITENGLQTDWPESLAGQVQLFLKELAARSDVYQPGRVYCYLCESSACEHANPPGLRSVFMGYYGNGKPRWRDFLQTMLEIDSEVARDLCENARLAAHYFRGRELKRYLLRGFGKASKTYDILSQVILGYLSFRRSDSGTVQLAVTLQAIESRKPDGAFRLTLNILANPAFCDEAYPMPSEHIPVLLEKMATSKYHREYRVIRHTQKRFREIERRINNAPPDARTGIKRTLMAEIPKIMMNIVHTVHHLDRQSLRRTGHADARRTENRPVPAAISDLEKATPGKCYWDIRRKTFAVLGKKQRVHIFTATGVHVTSLKLTTEQIQQRTARKRWRPATPEEWEKFIRNAL